MELNIEMKELLFRVLGVVKTLAEYVKELYLYAYRTCSTIIYPHSTNQVIICCLVDAVAVVGLCFFVVLEAEVAPSIRPCIDCTRMLTEV